MKLSFRLDEHVNGKATVTKMIDGFQCSTRAFNSLLEAQLFIDSEVVLARMNAVKSSVVQEYDIAVSGPPKPAPTAIPNAGAPRSPL